MSRHPAFALLGLALAAAGTSSAAATDAVGALSLPLARQMAAAAEARATANHADSVVTVVDAGGQMVLLERMPQAQLASIELAIAKAHSAVFYKRPTRSFEQDVSSGRGVNVLGLPGALPAGGGVPIMQGNTVIGAVGVSGGNNVQDNEAAEAGVAAFHAAAH
ncbi:GlcG/HbpS family heme-binding protein [Frateuria defendens]|uniref:GlcG/HbpS family heme-binding protein n=1 Tax=Frateuria defendens TaxID=2219559 RepID=UPI00069D4341|nr:heme-binding protein [Frateuria defendens]